MRFGTRDGTWTPPFLQQIGLGPGLEHTLARGFDDTDSAERAGDHVLILLAFDKIRKSLEPPFQKS